MLLPTLENYWTNNLV